MDKEQNAKFDALEPPGLGWCVIDEEKPSEGENYHTFHEWASRFHDAEHTVFYEQDVNDQWWDVFISPCGSEGCIKNCPALHSGRPRELWPIGFTQAIRLKLIAEPENPPTFEEWLERSRKNNYA
jgi:hypothetical protein